MSEQYAGLSLGVDVSQVDNAAKSLENFAKANDRAAKSTGDFVDQEQVARQKAKEFNEELKKQRTEFERLERSIDPSAAGMARLREQSKQLDSLWKKGMVPDDKFFSLSSMIETQTNALERNRKALTEEGRAALEESKSKERAKQQAQAFLSSLEQQASALGKSRIELLEMRAAQLGVSSTAEPIIASMRKQAEAAEVAAKATRDKAAADREAAAAQRAGAGFVNGLREQVDAIGKTRSELLEMKAAQLGVSASAAPLIAQLKAQEESLKVNAKQMGLAGMSAKQYQQALRFLPMQITDVVTSLASGMPVWMVAIQQGGQIKDSFGGIGNTFKVLLSYLTPVRIALGGLVGVLGGIAVAGYQSYKTQRDLSNALIMTGNYAATTTGEIRNLVDQLSQSSIASSGAIMGVATSLAKSGKFTSTQIKAIAGVTADWAEITGESADKIIADFDRISKDPVRGLLELNNTYNFLEKGQLTYIENIRKTKGETAAATAAIELYANTLKARTGAMADSLTPIEKMWQDVTKWSSDAWKTVGDHTIGALSLITDVVAGTVEQVQMILNKGDQLIGEFVISAVKASQKIPGMGNFAQGVVDQQQKIVDEAKKQNIELAKSIAERNKRVEQGEMGYIRARDAANENGKGKGYSSETKDAVEKEAEGIKKLNKEKKVTVDAGDRILDQYNQDILALQTQLKVLQEHKSINDSISQQRKTQWNEQAKLQILEKISNDSKGRALTQDEKSMLINKDKILALAEQKAVLGDQIVQQERANKLQDESTKFIEKSKAATEALNKSRSMSNEQARREAEKAAINSSWIAKGGSKDDPQLKAMQKAQDDYYAAEDAKRADWLAGAENAFANYGESATNMYANVGAVATSALDGMSDMMTEFLMTGKANFEDFAKSIISQIIKMITQMVIFNTISGAMGGGGWSFAGAAAGGKANGGIVGSNYSSGGGGFARGGFTGSGGKYEPAGIVHKGEFVMTKEATRRIGIANLYRMMRGYANGGAVGGTGGVSQSVGGMAGMLLNIGNIDISVNNGNDPKGMEQGIRMIFTRMIKESCSQGGEVFNYVQSKTA